MASHSHKLPNIPTQNILVFRDTNKYLEAIIAPAGPTPWCLGGKTANGSMKIIPFLAISKEIESVLDYSTQIDNAKNNGPCVWVIRCGRLVWGRGEVYSDSEWGEGLALSISMASPAIH